MNEQRKSPKAYAITLSKAWGNCFPVDVRQIAQEMSAKHYDPISKIQALPIPQEEFEGALLRKARGKKWGIAYSNHIREDGKVNFTISHEFGHYMLHREEHNQIACIEENLRDFPNISETALNIEQEANEFASYLLMPIDDYRAQVNGHQIDVALLSHCAARYATSLSASALKLIDFIDRPVAIIVSEGGRVKWSRSSQQALKLRKWFKKGTRLPANSISMKCVGLGTSKNMVQGVPVDGTVWSFEGSVIESAIGQPFYKTVFTILEFKTFAVRTDHKEEETFDAFDHFQSFSR